LKITQKIAAKRHFEGVKLGKSLKKTAAKRDFERKSWRESKTWKITQKLAAKRDCKIGLRGSKTWQITQKNPQQDWTVRE
jgi:hypothetical protein